MRYTGGTRKFTRLGKRALAENHGYAKKLAKAQRND